MAAAILLVFLSICFFLYLYHKQQRQLGLPGLPGVFGRICDAVDESPQNSIKSTEKPAVQQPEALNVRGTETVHGHLVVVLPKTVPQGSLLRLNEIVKQTDLNTQAAQSASHRSVTRSQRSTIHRHHRHRPTCRHSQRTNERLSRRSVSLSAHN